jgi:carboxymethylenebutenolidase
MRDRAPTADDLAVDRPTPRGAPLAVVHEIVVPLPDGDRVPAALALPDGVAAGGRASGSGVIVVHEAIGLNDDIRRIARRFADAGYPTLAPDFLAGLGPKPICIARFARGIGQVATGRPYRRIAAAQAWLAAHAAVSGGPIGVAGFCMGGGFALLHAVGAAVAVVAPFYAALPKDDAALAGVCPVVASYGGRDGIFGRNGERLEAALERLGVEHDVRTYPDAGHAFMSPHGGVIGRIGPFLPSHNRYDPVAAEDAWARTLAFFERHLRPGSADG